ncbi:hypothetical protein DH2020_042417 [Rehmannia glutinosa]|uniref:Uncharacterized protein n=1 Tax=Rehmannia glutinosa TaxID=99300 RepID=A0ABR0UMX1_REHGL
MAKLNNVGQWVLMGRRCLKPLARNRVFSSATKQWEGGVSMVQGASRGIGLEFVKQLLEKSDKGNVVATCRNPDGATGLLELKNKFAERLDIHQLDLTSDSTIEAAAKSVKDKYGYLNLLINASGVLSIPDVLQPGRDHMWPLLKAGGGIGTERDFAIVANISARVGSIGDNHLGGWHSYRSSKSGLNQCTVDTDLSRPFQKNLPEGKLFTKEFSVQNLLSIINNAKKSDNGKFFAWDGQEIPCDKNLFPWIFVWTNVWKYSKFLLP